MFHRRRKAELPPIEETAKDFRVVDGEPYMDEIFEYDIEVSRDFSRAELTEDEYVSVYGR